MKLRIRFTKRGNVRYIGHLDLQRYFQRAVRRAGIKVVYSEGFSPHQKMSFAMPLTVGYESDGEYFDLEVSGDASCPDIMERLNRQMTEGISITDCVILPEQSENAMASVEAADYTISFISRPPFDIEKTVEELTNASSFIIKKPVKKSKKRSGIKKASYNTKTMNSGNGTSDEPEYDEVDIRHLIYHVSADDDGSINLSLSAGSKDNVRPDLILKALYDRAGESFAPSMVRVIRRELYTRISDGGELVPLSGVGSRTSP